MELSVLTTNITEPVDHDEIKAFMGFPLSDTTQDDDIDLMITAARKWIEDRTALSLVSKSYKVYYDQEEGDEGWFELPVMPVLSSPAITVSMSGVSTTFQQRGLNRIRIMPDAVIGTMPVGSTSYTSYVEITFQAGANNDVANQIIKELVNLNFNHKDGGVGVSYSRLPYDLREKINGITNNL